MKRRRFQTDREKRDEEHCMARGEAGACDRNVVNLDLTYTFLYNIHTNLTASTKMAQLGLYGVRCSGTEYGRSSFSTRPSTRLPVHT